LERSSASFGGSEHAGVGRREGLRARRPLGHETQLTLPGSVTLSADSSRAETCRARRPRLTRRSVRTGTAGAMGSGAPAPRPARCAGPPDRASRMADAAMPLDDAAALRPTTRPAPRSRPSALRRPSPISHLLSTCGQHAARIGLIRIPAGDVATAAVALGAFALWAFALSVLAG
jgi:hypothetical protein